MTTIGWIVFGVICLLAVVAAAITCKKTEKGFVVVVALILAVAICTGAYFGTKALFPAEEKVEVTETEVTVEEAPTDAPAEEVPTNEPAGNE